MSDEKRWRIFYAKHLAQERGDKLGDSAEEAAYNVPPVPDIDAKWLHTEMMRISRTPDPHMGPALEKLRQAADCSGGKLILGALSNTCIFPPDHPLYEQKSGRGQKTHRLDHIFDLASQSQFQTRPPNRTPHPDMKHCLRLNPILVSASDRAP